MADGVKETSTAVLRLAVGYIFSLGLISAVPVLLRAVRSGEMVPGYIIYKRKKRDGGSEM